MSTSVPYPQGADASALPATGSAERITWWLALAAGALTIVLGILMLVWPEATLGVAAILFGLWLLIHGIVRIVQAITRTAEDGALRALMAVIGLLFVIGGVIALRNLVVSLAVIVTLVGLSWLISGVVEVVGAFRASGSSRTWLGVVGAISLIGGLVVLIWPKITLLTLVYLTGIWLLVIGAMQLVLVFQVRKLLT
jgi:uncharacterized membrane protein HdeD (DUF308 family)